MDLVMDEPFVYQYGSAATRETIEYFGPVCSVCVIVG